ncbi:MAG: MFS transporter [Rhizorhabdus sp.]
MSYLGEFRTHWRPLLAASIGVGFGYSLNSYLTNIFAPHLIQEFNWSRSDFALLGLAIIVIIISAPVTGLLTDRFGVRKMVSAAIVATPISYLGFSVMSGSFGQYYFLYVLQIILLGVTTGSVIHSRLIVHSFSLATGVALGVIACAPPLAGVISAPLLSALIDDIGWRASYQVVAAITCVFQIICYLLLPREKSEDEASAAAKDSRPAKPRVAVGYAKLMRNRTFLIICSGVFLCNLTLAMQMSQIKVMLLDVGVDAAIGSAMVSVYGVGVILGRLVCGLALDRYSARMVATISMGMPAISLFLLASGITAPVAVGLSILMLGIAFGAEGDIGAFLTVRYFPKEVFSSVFGLVLAAFALSAAAGGLLLSQILTHTDSFVPFLNLTGALTIVGALLFLLLEREPRPAEASPRAAEA